MANLADIRKQYNLKTLEHPDLADNPLKQFEVWFNDALEAEILEPNAMVLATADAQGRPSARVVLLKGVQEGAFVFYSNYHSRKGQDMAENPQVALVFNWLDLERQVRIEGEVQKVPQDVSEGYFHSRPRGSQLGAWVSKQSQVISGREVLDERLAGLEQRYPDAVPLPDFWGGYMVTPARIEFWQGRTNRLHDRFVYDVQEDGGWSLERLSP
jgi:pyridoxamine 5'-phosphate oxidase